MLITYSKVVISVSALYCSVFMSLAKDNACIYHMRRGLVSTITGKEINKILDRVIAMTVTAFLSTTWLYMRLRTDQENL